MTIDKIVNGYLEENCYVLTINNCCLVIDLGDDYPIIKEKIGNKTVLAILLTHSHFDHIGAVEDIRKEKKNPIYSFENLEEKEFTIDDFKFLTIYTPGHTNDSVCFYFKDEKIMFTGDFLFKESIGRWDLETGSFEKLKNSISKIKKYDDDITIYPGHGDISTIGYERDNNRYLFTK